MKYNFKKIFNSLAKTPFRSNTDPVLMRGPSYIHNIFTREKIYSKRNSMKRLGLDKSFNVTIL